MLTRLGLDRACHHHDDDHYHHVRLCVFACRRASRAQVLTCADLLEADPSRVQAAIGPAKATLFRGFAAGTDTRKWEPRPERKSMGAQSSWGVRFNTQPEAESFVQKLSAEVADRLTKQRLRGSQLTLKVWRAMEGAPAAARKGTMGHGLCDHISRSITLPAPTNTAAVLSAEAVKILTELRIAPTELRGVGVQVGKLAAGGGGGGGGGSGGGARPVTGGSGRGLPAQVARAPPATKYSPEKLPAWWREKALGSAPRDSVSGAKVGAASGVIGGAASGAAGNVLDVPGGGGGHRGGGPASTSPARRQPPACAAAGASSSGGAGSGRDVGGGGVASCRVTHGADWAGPNVDLAEIPEAKRPRRQQQEAQQAQGQLHGSSGWAGAPSEEEGAAPTHTPVRGRFWPTASSPVAAGGIPPPALAAASRTELLATSLDAMKDGLRIAYATAVLPMVDNAVGAPGSNKSGGSSSSSSGHVASSSAHQGGGGGGAAVQQPAALLKKMAAELLRAGRAAQNGSPGSPCSQSAAFDAPEALIAFGKELGTTSLLAAAENPSLGLDSSQTLAWLDACDGVGRQLA